MRTLVPVHGYPVPFICAAPAAAGTGLTGSRPGERFLVDGRHVGATFLSFVLSFLCRRSSMKATCVKNRLIFYCCWDQSIILVLLQYMRHSSGGCVARTEDCAST